MKYEVWYKRIADNTVEKCIATVNDENDAYWVCDALYSHDSEIGEEDTSEYYVKEVGKSK